MQSNKYLVLVFSLFLAGAVNATTVKVAEGQFVTVQATDDMYYPFIDSCLTVTYAYDTGVRSGGHAVLFPNDTQKTLEQMVQSLNGMNKAPIFYIIGAIQVWNAYYFGEAGKNFMINGAVVNLKNVESIVPALGYNAQTNAVLYDKDKYTSNAVNIPFQANPKMLMITDYKTGKVLYNKPYDPPIIKDSNTLL